MHAAARGIEHAEQDRRRQLFPGLSRLIGSLNDDEGIGRLPARASGVGGSAGAAHHGKESREGDHVKSSRHGAKKAPATEGNHTSSIGTVGGRLKRAVPWFPPLLSPDYGDCVISPGRRYQ